MQGPRGRRCPRQKHVVVGTSWGTAWDGRWLPAAGFRWGSSRHLPRTPGALRGVAVPQGHRWHSWVRPGILQHAEDAAAVLPGGLGAERVVLGTRGKLLPWLRAPKGEDISALGKGTDLSSAGGNSPPPPDRAGRRRAGSPRGAAVIWESCQSAHSRGTSASHPPDGS